MVLDRLRSSGPSSESRIAGGILGLVVGDALGVPVQFLPREVVRANPITGMDRAESPGRPPGTWSDDSSMALATIASLIDVGWDPRDVMDRFARWFFHGDHTPHGEAWDVGGTTQRAIERFAEGMPINEVGGREEHDNGNGSLMRILPVALWHAQDPHRVIVERAREASALTHAHPRTELCCAIYSLVVHAIMQGAGIRKALGAASRLIEPIVPRGEREVLKRLLSGAILDARGRDVESSGYVVHTLEAALWCCARHADYRSIVLEAVNLGDDADTTGAVAGGLAGVLYGEGAVPQEWVQALEQPNVVWHMAHRFADVAGHRRQDRCES